MSYSRRSRYSRSPSPRGRRSISSSVSRSSRSRGYDSEDAENPGNNLYVTGLSTRLTKKTLEKHFSSQGKVEDVHLVVDPWTRESRGFGFITMSTLEEADRCIKYLDSSILEGRVITVEKARRKRGRTPTPGRYLGLRKVHVRRHSRSYSPYYSRSRSRSRSYTPDHHRSPYARRGHRSSSYSGERSYSVSSRSRSRSYSRSPAADRGRGRSRSLSYSPDEDRHRYRRYEYRSRCRITRDYYSPDDYDYRRGYRRRSVSREGRRSRRSLSRSVSVSSRSRSYSSSESYSRSASSGRRRDSSRRRRSRGSSRSLSSRSYSSSSSR